MGSPRTIGDIQPFAVLHDGAIARVYKGYQPALGRFVLLKVLKAAHAQDAALVEQFEAEARLVARVQHPNVVAVHDCGRDDGQVYLVAEFVEGTDLRALIEVGPLPPGPASFIALEAARGLQAAHARDVLHRDLKPANLLVAAGGQVKVADFGMASLAGAPDAGNEVRGTPAYLAPEQLLGEPPTPAADLFALGATLYELLAGRPAFAGASTDDVLDAVLHHDPLPALDLQAKVPEPLHRVCARLLTKDPADRYAGSAEAVAALEAARRAMGCDAGQEELAEYLRDPAGYQPPVPVHTQEDSAPAEASDEEESAANHHLPRVMAVAVLGLLVVAFGYFGVVRWNGTDEPAPPMAVAPVEDAPLRPSSTQTAAAGRTADAGPVAAPDSTTSANSTTSADSTPVEPEHSPPAEERPDVQDQEEPPPDQTDRSDPEQQEPQTEASASAVARGTTADAPSPAERPPRHGRLRVASVPWAAVFVDGDSVGTTPLTTPLTLDAGTHQIELRHPRLPVYRDTVHVAAGRLTERTVALWEQVARLVVEVTPWAEVLVDGAVRDTTPQVRPLILAPGTHTLTLRHPTLGTWERRIYLRAGEIRTLSTSLSR